MRLRTLVWREIFERKNQLATSFFAILLGVSVIVAMKNIKYRYLALGTLAATVLHLFIVDLARIEIVFRVVAFMFVALISLGLSLYYNKRRKSRIASEEANPS